MTADTQDRPTKRLRREQTPKEPRYGSQEIGVLGWTEFPNSATDLGESLGRARATFDGAAKEFFSPTIDSHVARSRVGVRSQRCNDASSLDAHGHRLCSQLWEDG